MDRNIDRSLDLIKAKIIQLRRLLTRKDATKQGKEKLLNLTPAQLQQLPFAQRVCIEKAQQKLSQKTDKRVNEYNDYTDCYGEYYDADYE